MSFHAPDVVYDMSADGMGVLRGYAALREHLQEWWGAYEEYEIELEEIQDLGEVVALCAFAQRARPPGSAGWVQQRHAAISTLRVGLIERITVYTDIDEARAAAKRLAEPREGCDVWNGSATAPKPSKP
jgi:hypothetical protein